MPFQKTFLLPGHDLQALCAGEYESQSAVIVLHGLGVAKEVQIPELERLRHAGYFALALDAPHHGSRADGLLDILNRKTGHERHHLLLATVLQHCSEVADLVRYLKNNGKNKVAVTGISMGAHVAFALLRMKNVPDLLAPFLGTPDFRTREPDCMLPASPAELTGPAQHPEEVFPASLFVVTAGGDSVVNPAPCRKFIEDIGPFYRDCPQKLEYHEYPESDHMMRPSDWFDAWGKFLERLKRDGF
jgi:dienelactone hydrolase